MQHKLALIQEKIKSLFVTYPIVLLMSLAMAATIIYAIETRPSKEAAFFLTKLSIVFSLGISLMFALKMLSQRIGKEILWHSLGFIFLIGFYFILPTKEKDFTAVYAFLLVPTYILCHLLVAFIAYIKKENTENSFWQFNKNLFINFFLTVVFTGVLTAGIQIAIVAIENLFSFNFNEIYAEIFVFCCFKILYSIYTYSFITDIRCNSLFLFRKNNFELGITTWLGFLLGFSLFNTGNFGFVTRSSIKE
jgi:hypothetical protein